MEDRIKINGVWYIKEDTYKHQKEEEEKFDFIAYEGVVVEDSDFCFDATQLIGSDNSLSIEVINKTKEPFQTDFWDNKTFFEGVLEEDKESLGELKMLGKSKKMFIELLKHLKTLNWI